MASIVEVARRAGVSITTASRVINNSSHPVSAATRARVLKVMEELNFRPSALARAMITKRTQIIGVIVGDSSDPYFSVIIRGIEDVARKRGYLVIICNSERDPEVEYNYLSLMRDYHVDGLIFAGGSRQDETALRRVISALEELHSTGVAIVALNPHLFPAPQVSIDNVAAAREMTEHLLALGHRRIAYIDGPAEITTSALRRRGYREALEAAGLPPDPALIWPGDYTFESGLSTADRFIASNPRPTAIFASNDQMAIGAITSLRRLGITVPNDVSVAGLDDIPSARYIEPPLTTIEVPLHQLGAYGMQTILCILSGESVESFYLSHTLIVRRSTAPPATES
ncbi:MAG TPA: LacI family transcriptional regulator [Chloroflexi bacterium]|nr:LacI family transcriptional regulator [Chloroflexota bacterium]